MFLNAFSTISFQPTFRNPGFTKELSELAPPFSLKSPDYSEFIKPREIRRMSEIMKMGIACTKDCLNQAGIQQPGAIIVGTSLGSCVYTDDFLGKIYADGGGPLSPTSFISSTHNTVAGQIALELRNHNYNITYTHGSLSFEHALFDGMMCIREGMDHILVGGVDESSEGLYNISTRLGIEIKDNACGSSFFVLSRTDRTGKELKLKDVAAIGLNNKIEESLLNFIRDQGLSKEDIDLVLYSAIQNHAVQILKSLFQENKMIDFRKLSGTYFVHSGFALNYAADLLSGKNWNSGNKSVSRILICNNLVPENLGLILLEKSH